LRAAFGTPTMMGVAGNGYSGPELIFPHAIGGRQFGDLRHSYFQTACAV